MSDSLTIPKDPVYPISMDWQLLRREGIRHIERLGSDIWTDYNTHDPGISTLEILCYAITDLGYRTNFEPSKLFASNNGQSFFTAAEMLTCGPVTALDLRKILADIPGIKNAWVEQADADVRFFLKDASTSQPVQIIGEYAAIPLLNITPEHSKTLGDLIASAFSIEKLFTDLVLLTNLYKCQNDKDRDLARQAFRDQLGNAARSAFDAVADVELKKALVRSMLLYVIEIFFDESIYFLENELLLSDSIAGSQKSRILIISRELRILKQGYGDENFTYDWDKKLEPGAADSSLQTLLLAYNEIVQFFFIDPMLCILISSSIARPAALPGEVIPTDWYNLFIPQGVYSVSLLLEEDAAGDETDIIQEALKRLHTHRNLCEDFHPKVRIIEKIEMGIDLAVELDPAMDTLELMAQIWQAINNYLSPEIIFYSLEQMRNRYAIFEIDEEVLAQLTELQVPDNVVAALSPLTGKQIIGDTTFELAVEDLLKPDDQEDYYADIFIQAKKVYDTDKVYNGPLLEHGFIAEEELLLAQPRQTVYRSDIFQVITAIEGVLEIDRLEIYKCDETEQRLGNWCLQFDCKCLPEVSLSCSYFSVRSHGIDLPVSTEKIREYLGAHPVSGIKIDRKGMLDLAVSTNQAIKNLDEFTSIQIDFPRTYKIGNTGIDKKQPMLRQGQAKQLQAYLFYFDQLLANYLTQLANVKEIFSVHPAPYQNYQTLYNIPGIKDILLDYLPDTSWDAFTADKNNAYVKVLELLSNVSSTNRQTFDNKVLDHMLARFGEQFTDFAIQLYKIERPIDSSAVWETGEGLDDVIQDKKRMLSDLPALGTKRAEGFYYHFDPQQVPRYWKTDNVEGVKKRVAAILGMGDSHRDTITCEPVFVVESGPMRIVGASSTARTKYEYYIKPSADSNERLLVSTAKFSNPETAIDASTKFLNTAVDKNSYGIVNDNQVGFWAGVVPEERTADNALLLELKENPDQPEQRLKYILDLASGNCDDDGFHILEHILLRPISDAYTAALNPILCCLDDIEALDPYSFWITVVMPDWTGRFSEPKRLEVFMQTVMKEMPAHLAVRFCLLSREYMFKFEELYHGWLEKLCSPQQTDLPSATDELVTVMNTWDKKNIYHI